MVGMATRDPSMRRWRYRGTVALAQDDMPTAPTEATSMMSSDRSRLLSVFRVQTTDYERTQMWIAYSTDATGHKWSRATRLHAGQLGYLSCVSPIAVALSGGLTLISSGRPGLYLWGSATPEDPSTWQEINVAQHHNQHVPWAPFSSITPHNNETTAYQGMVATGPDSAILCYDKGLPIPDGDSPHL